MKILLRRFYFVMTLGILMGIVLCAQVANAKRCSGSLGIASKYLNDIPGIWCAKKEKESVYTIKFLTHDCKNYYVKLPKTDPPIYVQCKLNRLWVNRDPNKDYACAPDENDSCNP